MRVIKSALLVLLIQLFLPDRAFSATYYVSKSTANGWAVGADINSCSTTMSPCLSIGGGLKKISSGDTLIINDGIYVESLDDAVPSGGGSEETRTIIKCYKPRACTLDASFFAWNFVNSDTNWITIQDMVICCGDTVLVRLASTTPPPSVNYPHHIRIQGNDIHTGAGYCVYTGHGQYNEFIDNKIHGCREQGVYALFRDSIFRGNEVYDVGLDLNKPNYSQGMQMGISGGMMPSNNLLEGNIFRNSPSACLIIYGGVGHVIRRNIFTDCGFGLTVKLGEMDNSNVDHNIFFGNAYGLEIANPSSTGNRVRNNISIGNRVSNFVLCDGCATDTTNIKMGDPDAVWVDPIKHNFKLKQSSPAIDACTPIGITFSGSAPDCGAYEYLESAKIQAPKNLRVK